MNSAELQKLLDAAPDGSTVILPAGEHTIDAPLLLGRGLRITGQAFTARFTVTCEGEFLVSVDDTRPAITQCYFDCNSIKGK